MMKTILTLISFTCITLISFATELNYKWKANTSYTFNSVVTDNITTSMMGMNVKEKFITTIDFVLFIQTVQTDGTAQGRLYLVNYNVKDSKGMTVASLVNIPKDALRSEVTVDKKGIFTFKKKVTMITTPTSNVLVYANVDENGANAGIQTGTEKMDVYAEFDPKTGKLKAGYTLATIKTTKKVDVKQTEESDEIDVFPYDFLSALAMPDGHVAAGNTYQVKAGLYTVDILVKSMAAGTAVIEEKISTDKSADMFEGSANGQTEEGSFSMEGFGGTDQMELTEEDQAAMGMANAMSPVMNGTLNTTFDHANGMFVSVSGTINTSIEMMGMKMDVNSVIVMKKK